MPGRGRPGHGARGGPRPRRRWRPADGDRGSRRRGQARRPRGEPGAGRVEVWRRIAVGAETAAVEGDHNGELAVASFPSVGGGPGRGRGSWPVHAEAQAAAREIQTASAAAGEVRHPALWVRPSAIGDFASRMLWNLWPAQRRQSLL
uniref:Uncharacterized protein n=1 Tax=Setaria viridis TaxID=4556 RepID=A0A4U6U286_SETVI|nr:hypothetical protein SEVIR_6G022400v2 [Setaria viridis]